MNNLTVDILASLLGVVIGFSLVYFYKKYVSKLEIATEDLVYACAAGIAILINLVIKSVFGLDKWHILVFAIALVFIPAGLLVNYLKRPKEIK